MSMDKITLPGSVLEYDGQVLSYDPDDVESVEFATPRDVHELPDEGDGIRRRELGQAHLELKLHFKPGKHPRWIDRKG